MTVNAGLPTRNDAGSVGSGSAAAAQTVGAWLGGTGAVVEVSGDLDVYSVPRFHNALLDLHESGRIRVIVDMTELDFMDSVGLGVLILDPPVGFRCDVVAIG
jgi:hypothetical protein